MRFLRLSTAIFGWRERGGPFAAMRCVHTSVRRTLAPKLLGSYERELDDRVEQLVARDFSTILNSGAAEGIEL